MAAWHNTPYDLRFRQTKSSDIIEISDWVIPTPIYVISHYINSIYVIMHLSEYCAIRSMELSSSRKSIGNELISTKGFTAFFYNSYLNISRGGILYIEVNTIEPIEVNCLLYILSELGSSSDTWHTSSHGECGSTK